MGLCEYDCVFECISHLHIISKFHLNVNADNSVKTFNYADDAYIFDFCMPNSCRY